MRRALLVLGVTVLVAALLSACTGSRPSSEGGFVSGDGSITRFPVAERKVAPVIAGRTIDDKEFSSTAFAGKVLVYNVWGSWCSPCRKEAPALVAAAKRTADVAQFVGLNTRDLDPVPALAFVRAFGVPYPNVFDPDGRLLLPFATLVPATAIPSTLVIDAQGRVAARVVGETTEATLAGLVADVAAGR